MWALLATRWLKSELPDVMLPRVRERRCFDAAVLCTTPSPTCGRGLAPWMATSASGSDDALPRDAELPRRRRERTPPDPAAWRRPEDDEPRDGGAWRLVCDRVRVAGGPVDTTPAPPSRPRSEPRELARVRDAATPEFRPRSSLARAVLGGRVVAVRDGFAFPERRAVCGGFRPPCAAAAAGVAEVLVLRDARIRACRRRACTRPRMRITCARCSCVCGLPTSMGHSRMSWQVWHHRMAEWASRSYMMPSMTEITVPVRPWPPLSTTRVVSGGRSACQQRSESPHHNVPAVDVHVLALHEALHKVVAQLQHLVVAHGVAVHDGEVHEIESRGRLHALREHAGHIQ